MKRRRKFGGTSLLAVPLRSAGLGGWRRQTQLRSTASKEGRGSRGADLTTGVGLQNEELLTKNRSQRVTPLLAQRITLTGNSYFWRTAKRFKWHPLCKCLTAKRTRGCLKGIRYRVLNLLQVEQVLGVGR